MKNANDIIGNRTHDLPACSAVPQQTAPPRTIHHVRSNKIRGIMDAQYIILDDITWQKLIWYGHVERMDPTTLPKVMILWKPEGRKKRGRPRRTWKGGIYTAMNERDLSMGEWNNRRQWNMKVGRRRQTY